MESKPLLFPKSQRIKGQKVIETLFQTGEAFFVKPYKVIYVLKKDVERPELKIGVAVPKKNFKKAVHRNLLKRRCREAYRLSSSKLVDVVNSKNVALYFMFVNTDKEITDYKNIEIAIKKALKQLEFKIYA